MADLYRKSALERLTSSEQLDATIVITPPSFWLAMVGILSVLAAVLIWAFSGRLPVTVPGDGIIINDRGIHTVYSDQEGIVSSVYVSLGDSVHAGQTIALLGGSTNIPLKTYVDGIVTEIPVSPGSVLTPGSEVLHLRSESSARKVVCYLPLESGKRLSPGMPVKVYPSVVNKQEYGHMEAVIESVDSYVTSPAQMQSLLGNTLLVDEFTQNGPVVAVSCLLRKDPSTASGYAWSSRKGAKIMLAVGTPVTVDVVTDYVVPADLVIPGISGTFSGGKG